METTLYKKFTLIRSVSFWILRPKLYKLWFHTYALWGLYNFTVCLRAISFSWKKPIKLNPMDGAYKYKQITWHSTVQVGNPFFLNGRYIINILFLMLSHVSVDINIHSILWSVNALTNIFLTDTSNYSIGWVWSCWFTIDIKEACRYLSLVQFYQSKLVNQTGRQLS